LLIFLAILKFNIFRDRLSASDMMIVRKVIEYIYDRYVLNEQQQQQQQQQQNTSLTTAGNGLSKTFFYY
jgi:hypothetical protein